MLGGSWVVTGSAPLPPRCVPPARIVHGGIHDRRDHRGRWQIPGCVSVLEDVHIVPDAVVERMEPRSRSTVSRRSCLGARCLVIAEASCGRHDNTEEGSQEDGGVSRH